MTKIYLVRTSYLANSKWYDVVSGVFTNKQKALSYMRYLNAKKEVQEQEGKNWWEIRETIVDEHTICHSDWTQEAVEEESKLLP